jgi:hypothetical protein
MSLVRSLVFLTAFAVPALAQHFSHPVTASRDDAFSSARAPLAFPDTVRILAVMAQFQADADVGTTGDGRFVTSAGSDSVIDAPPRNRAYFENHLAFVENYFRKSSKGKLVIRWTVIDSVFTLPSVMSVYSPAKTAANTPLAILARDTWRKVDSSGRVADFTQYDCFVLFHAGAGRDIDLVGTLGYDPSPRDIPSLYLGPSALNNLLGGGIKVKGGAFTITNTIIIPETESRRIPGVTGDFLLELSINGLLCASVGNHLGLPDLFDTKTGRSGIGRFGLMDGQAIFSFSGLFPPEPSAWEKYWLGWITPITVPPGPSALMLPAVTLADSVFRIPISDGEYYLMENRNRDAGRNGQRVTSVFNGVTRQQVFPRDTAGFNAFDISALAGTVTDVEDLDWSLPGGVDDAGVMYDGGILIWHVDEPVIQATIVDDGVNANPDRRGVDLEEADGSQDIGQAYGQFSAGSGSEEGTALDFWYKGSASPVNKNVFNATSYPNTNSNTGALTHIAVSNFSDRGIRMTATVVRGDNIGPLKGYPRQTGESISSPTMTVAEASARPGPEVIIGTPGQPIARQTTGGSTPPASVTGKLYLLPSDSTAFVPPFRTAGVIASASAPSRGFTAASAVADLNGDGVPEIITVETGAAATGPTQFLRAYSARDANADSLADAYFSSAVAPVTDHLGDPVLSDSLIAVIRTGSRNIVYFFRFSGVLADSILLAGPPLAICRWPGRDAFVIAEGTSLRLTVRTPSGSAARPDVIRSFSGMNMICTAVGLFGTQATGTRVLIASLSAGGSLFLVDSTLTPVQGFPVATGELNPIDLALADIDGDGSRDIVVLTSHRVNVYNIAGSPVEHFPVEVQSSFASSGRPGGSVIIGDVDGDGRVDIVGVSTQGLVSAFTRNGTQAPGFPLAVGSGAQQQAALAVNGGNILLFAVSSDGSISAWVTGRVQGTVKPELYPWAQYGRDERHSGLDISALTGTAISSDFFPAERAYNWPNPVYAGKTYIRYYVKENAAVNVKIYDLAGGLVTELSGRGTGGVDNEIAWDVTGVQSGIYFARVEATGAGGSGLKIVKIAVVK